MSANQTEDAVVEMIRSRGRVGRRKYRTTMDRRDLHPDEWVKHHQEELADALQYAERIKGATKLLHEARDIMLTLLREREWECASQWVNRYNDQFSLPRNVDVDTPSPTIPPEARNDTGAGRLAWLVVLLFNAATHGATIALLSGFVTLILGLATMAIWPHVSADVIAGAIAGTALFNFFLYGCRKMILPNV